MAQPAELSHKLSFFSPAQKEISGPDKWIEVATSSASSFYLFSAGQYFSIPAPYSAAALFQYPGHYRTWLIVVKCYRSLTVFCLFSHQWARWIPHETNGFAWMWFPKESECSSSPNLLTLPVPFKCVFYEVRGSVHGTIEKPLESYRFGFKYYINYLLISCGNLNILRFSSLICYDKLLFCFI